MKTKAKFPLLLVAGNPGRANWATLGASGDAKGDRDDRLDKRPGGFPVDSTPTSDVLTLEEAAAYLRVPPEALLHQVTQGNLPGRKIDETWRFLRVAIDDWLRLQDSRILLLQQAGAFADDESLADLRTAIYQARARSEVDDGTQSINAPA